MTIPNNLIVPRAPERYDPHAENEFRRNLMLFLAGKANPSTGGGGGGGGGASALDDLTDVTITSPTTGDALQYGGGGWVNAPLPAPPAVPDELNDLSDVDAPAPSDGHVLAWVAADAEWQAVAPSGGGGTGWPTALPGTPDHWFRVESLSGLSNGDPVGTWPDEGAQAWNLTATGSERPEYVEGVEDGMPFVRFDAVSEVMQTAAGSAYTGQELTMFIVYRKRGMMPGEPAVSLFPGLVSLHRGTADWNEAQSLAVTTYGNASSSAKFERESTVYPGAGKIDQSAYSENYQWTVLGVTMRVDPDGHMMIVRNNTAVSFAYAVSTKSFGWTHIIVGARYASGVNNYNNVDVREIVIYRGALYGDDFWTALSYLRAKCGVEA